MFVRRQSYILFYQDFSKVLSDIISPSEDSFGSVTSDLRINVLTMTTIYSFIETLTLQMSPKLFRNTLNLSSEHSYKVPHTVR